MRVMIAVAFLVGCNKGPTPQILESRPVVHSHDEQRETELREVTMARFMAIKTGMTVQQVAEILGSTGEQMSETNIAGVHSEMRAWKNPNGSNMNALFQRGRVVSKAQFGLR